jgi:hypothetical protein
MFYHDRNKKPQERTLQEWTLQNDAPEWTSTNERSKNGNAYKTDNYYYQSVRGHIKHFRLHVLEINASGVTAITVVLVV